MFGECHAHIFMNGTDYRAARDMYRNGPVEDDIRAKLKAYKDAGVTFIRDGGDNCGASLFASRIAGEYGISYASPSFAIHKNGFYGAIVGRGFDTIGEYTALVKQVRKDGGSFIKIMASGILDFSGDGSVTGGSLPEGLIRSMIHIAHEEGFAVMVHVNGAENILECIEGGADTIEHGNYINSECIKALAASGCVWVPTISTIYNLLSSDRFDRRVIEAIYHDTAGKIAEAYRAGCAIALGSDAGAFAVPHVKGIYDEYRIVSDILKCAAYPGTFLQEEADERFAAAQERIRKAFLPTFL